MRRFAPPLRLVVAVLFTLLALPPFVGATPGASHTGCNPVGGLQLQAQALGGGLSRLTLDDLPDVARVRRLFQDRPFAGALLVALSFVVAVLIASLLPVLFPTRDLDLRRSYLLSGLIFVSWIALAFLVVVLDYVWVTIGWSPWTGVSNAAMTIIAAVAGVVVALIAFRLRMAVSWQQTLIVTPLWLLVVAGCGLIGWLFLLPVLPF